MTSDDKIISKSQMKRIASQTEDKIEAWLSEIDQDIEHQLDFGKGDVHIYFGKVNQLLALVRVYREANLDPFTNGCVRCDIARAAEEKAKEIVGEET